MPKSAPNLKSGIASRQIYVGEVSPLHGPMLARKASRTQRRGGDQYSQYVMFFVYASLLSSLYTELRGDGFVALIGSFNLWSSDIATFISAPMVLYAFFHPSRDFTTPRLILLGWLAIIALWVMRAILVDPFMALFTFRVYAAYCAALLAFSLRPVSPDVFRKICWAFIWAGLILAVLAVVRTFFIPQLFMAANLSSYEYDNRPIFAPAALIMGEAAVFAMSLSQADAESRSRGKKWGSILTIGLIMGLLISGQRTVAIGVGVSFVILAMNKAGSRFGAFINRIIIFGCLPVIVVIAIADSPILLSFLPGSFEGANASGDFEFRIQLWEAIQQSFMSWSLLDQFLGNSASWMLQWHLSLYNIYDQRSAHNEALGVLIITGVAGLLLLVVAIAVCFFGTVRTQMRSRSLNVSGLPAVLVLALLTILVIYGVSYEWLYEQGIVLGLCVAGFHARHSYPVPNKA